MTRRQPARSMATSVATVPATVLVPSGGNSDARPSASIWNSRWGRGMSFQKMIAEVAQLDVQSLVVLYDAGGRLRQHDLSTVSKRAATTVTRTPTR